MQATSIDEARGHEGIAGQVYFSGFDHMIGGDREAFHVSGPFPTATAATRVNALLSFVYAFAPPRY